MWSRVLGTDEKHLNVPLPHLSGHLAPGAGDAEGGEQTVSTDGVFDAVAFPHGDPHGQGDGGNNADVQQGETQTLTVLLGGYTGETR